MYFLNTIINVVAINIAFLFFVIGEFVFFHKKFTASLNFLKIDHITFPFLIIAEFIMSFVTQNKPFLNHAA